MSQERIEETVMGTGEIVDRVAAIAGSGRSNLACIRFVLDIARSDHIILHILTGIVSCNLIAPLLTECSRNTIPFIFLGGAERNDDGSFKMGSSFPLYVYNSIGAGEIRWTFNGKEPKLNDEGLFVVEGNGTLRAEVFYEDGSCDIIAKEIIAR